MSETRLETGSDHVPTDTAEGFCERIRDALSQVGMLLAKASEDERRHLIQRTRQQFDQAELPLEAFEDLQFLYRTPDECYPMQAPQHLGAGGLNNVYGTSLYYGWNGPDDRAEPRLVIRVSKDGNSYKSDALRRQHQEIVHDHLIALPAHPNLPQCFGMAHLGGPQGMLCEIHAFKPGLNLGDFLQERTLSLSEFLTVARGTARAAAHLHRYGLGHNDIKKGNILVAKTEADELQITLIDPDLVDTEEHMVEGYSLDSIMGTLPHIPPESFRGMYPGAIPDGPEARQRMAEARDVFALGVTLYETLSGSLPPEISQGPLETVIANKMMLHELSLTFPPHCPVDLMTLISSMCRSDWKARPSLAATLRALNDIPETEAANLRETVAFRRTPVAMPEAPTQVVSRIGSYHVYQRAFSSIISPDDGQRIELARLLDPMHRPMLGIPRVFSDEDAARSYYEERKVAADDLNRVRLRHPLLFPGVIDLALEQHETGWTVWAIRPLLENAQDLRQYLFRSFPNTSLRERAGVIQHVADSLAALEEEGYRHPGFGLENIYTVPLPAPEENTESAHQTVRFDFSGLVMNAGQPPMRRELMQTIFAQKSPQDTHDHTVMNLRSVADRIGVSAALGNAGALRAMLTALRECNWARRAENLRDVLACLEA